jgi:hypothetical protein
MHVDHNLIPSTLDLNTSDLSELILRGDELPDLLILKKQVPEFFFGGVPTTAPSLHDSDAKPCWPDFLTHNRDPDLTAKRLAQLRCVDCDVNVRRATTNQIRHTSSSGMNSLKHRPTVDASL